MSFGMPYLMPFVKKEDGGGTGEGILRLPFRKRKKTSCLRQTGRKAKAEKEGRALKFAEKQQNFPQTALPSDDPCLPCAFSFSVCRGKEGLLGKSGIAGVFLALALLALYVLLLLRMVPWYSDLVKSLGTVSGRGAGAFFSRICDPYRRLILPDLWRI